MKSLFKKFIFVLSLAAFIPGLASCGSNKIELEKIEDYFYKVGTYKSFDYDYVNDYFAQEYDNWGGGCSAISAVINGKRLVGRNMDLNISNKCTYVVETKASGKYATIGLEYTFRDVSPDYAEVEKNGLGEKWEKILPFMCDDVLNSEGLHIELNMRHSEFDKDGNDLFSVEHTNPNAKERVYVFNLCQYFALNCKDLNACKEYLKNDIDVYSKKGYWNYCFLITDAEGNSNLLEFGNGKYYWIEPDANGVIAQTNFYINEECAQKQDIKTGLGRYDTMVNSIKGVKSKSDLYFLMKKVSFSWFYYGYDTCSEYHFDPRSELIGEPNELDIDLTYDFLYDPENQEFISQAITAIGTSVTSLTREQQRADNAYWESSFTAVIDPQAKTIEVRLFEDERSMYHISFDGIHKILSIK